MVDAMLSVMRLEDADPELRGAAAQALYGTTITDPSAQLTLRNRLEYVDPNFGS